MNQEKSSKEIKENRHNELIKRCENNFLDSQNQGENEMNLTFNRDVEMWIQDCQKENHIQQVAYSTYHSCLTQVCFTCNCVRTSIDKEDLKLNKSEVYNTLSKNESKVDSIKDTHSDNKELMDNDYAKTTNKVGDGK